MGFNSATIGKQQKSPVGLTHAHTLLFQAGKLCFAWACVLRCLVNVLWAAGKRRIGKREREWRQHIHTVLLKEDIKSRHVNSQIW